MCVIVRLIARPFMSWSDTTPAANVAGTNSYLAAVRRTDRIPLWHLVGVFMTLQKASCAPSRAHSAPAALRQVPRELPRWQRDHGLLHGQARRRRQHRG